MPQTLPIECPKCHAPANEPCVNRERVHDERDMANQERIYENVKAKLDAAERSHVEGLRAEREAGNRYNAYGHDLIAAIRHAQYNDAFDKAEALFDNEWIDGRFGLALSRIIDAAARRGVSEERIRRSLQRTLDAQDSTRIGKRIESYAGKSVDEAKKRL